MLVALKRNLLFRPSEDELEDDTSRSLGEQLQAVHHRIDETNRRIDESNKRMDVHFRWTMTTLVTITGILIAVIKL